MGGDERDGKAEGMGEIESRTGGIRFEEIFGRESSG